MQIAPVSSTLMKLSAIFPVVLLPLFAVLTGCDKKPETREHSGEVNSAAGTLTPVKDPVGKEIDAFLLKNRQAYNRSQFDVLEEVAADLRRSKATFENGSWKIAQFYGSFECRDDEPESMWELHDKIHRNWIAAKPDSVTAKVAYADFLTSYAWRARGDGYADKVTENGWRVFGERLKAAGSLLGEARALPDKDPCLWLTALTVALGQGASIEDYDLLMEEAHAFEPKFWGYAAARAHSLLPRWYGEPGEWEAFALKASEQADGLGVEVYARIVMRLSGFHKNIFEESQVSWPKTREGLEVLMQKYPQSSDFVNISAHLGGLAVDREFARRMFDQLGNSYSKTVWRTPQKFIKCRDWVMTGVK